MEEKPVNKTNTNGYTFMFSIIMVVVVASVLAFTATTLQPIQNENVRQEKMQNILATVGIETERSEAEELYNEYITETIALNEDGSVAEGTDAFTVDLAKELKKPGAEQLYPLYIANVEGAKYYIIPLRGKGLWDAIFGYISLKDDVNTIKGAVFDHKGETPGLGGEITQMWFKQSFADEKIFDSSGNLIGVSVVKGNVDPTNKDDNKVDAISGATITGDGVSDMISERLLRYLPYFKKQTDIKVAIQ
ncbi:Na(+)-translocating NADH-quinone reductase subunit C [Gillisia hiemivivida]|jgi:Na+-transporting NADH:ubiquinone oxidoreductase subunit C|uniref:Na(+)-translocating NADH-quinone reductase subunit C n=1 Tax=Gillisia hiemivivida TaxID=291190 RepID=A0A5C6ZPK7_9FLAO|nr:Na(+)-translocating NADH-quinone reductase subunit C [Gillisia hiemivivida]TXD92606.1 Na(+)-translocating NADH-quinone reductase subunit C [Gillisia hiemivivida]